MICIIACYGDWTRDHQIKSLALYHWAKQAWHNFKSGIGNIGEKRSILPLQPVAKLGTKLKSTTKSNCINLSKKSIIAFVVVTRKTHKHGISYLNGFHLNLHLKHEILNDSLKNCRKKKHVYKDIHYHKYSSHRAWVPQN